MRVILFLLAVSLIIGCSPSTPDAVEDKIPSYVRAVPDIESIHGLIGSWKDVLGTDSTEFFETWASGTNNVLEGTGYVLATEDTIMIEDLAIKQIDDEFVYNARVRSQNNNDWVQFLLMPSGNDTLRFFNPQHDFPQEIMYVKDGDAWNVSISSETGESGKFRLEQYPDEG